MGDRGAAVQDITPYDVVARSEVTRPTPKSLLTALCRGLEREALAAPPPVAAVTLQDVRHLTPATLATYAELARAGTAVTMFARGLQAWLAPGVRGVALGDDDPLGDVWSLVFVGGARPVAMAALDLFTEGVTDAARGFRAATTREPQLVEACARVLGVDPPPVSGTAAGGTRQP